MTDRDGELLRDLATVLNRHSMENWSGTPDFILAEYLVGVLRTWQDTIRARDDWWDFSPKIRGTIPAVKDVEHDSQDSQD